METIERMKRDDDRMELGWAFWKLLGYQMNSTQLYWTGPYWIC